MRASLIRCVETRRLITSNRNHGDGIFSDLTRRILQSCIDGCECERMCLRWYTLHTNPEFILRKRSYEGCV